MMENAFIKLNAVNVNDKTERKNGLTYLSWAWAWAEVKKLYPDANYTIYERPDGVIYWTDGRTCWVKTGVTIAGIEHIEYLPIMDHRNRSIPVDIVTSYDVNKTIQRSLTKACARHGLGLYIYAGEDLPEECCETQASGATKEATKAAPKAAPKETAKAKPKAEAKAPAGMQNVSAEQFDKFLKEGIAPMADKADAVTYICADCKAQITADNTSISPKTGLPLTAAKQAEGTFKRFGRSLCGSCVEKQLQLELEAREKAREKAS